MTLHVYTDIEQGTPEWDDVRRGMVTASVVAQLVTPNTLKVASNGDVRSVALRLVAERITGWTDPTFSSDDMFNGHISEPIARDIYSGHYQQAVELGFMAREEDGWMLGLSPDGLVADEGLVEIKSPRSKEHIRTILADEVPRRYVPQCQAALLVSGREWCDFVSYCGGLPLFVKRILPDPAWHEAIEAACRTFETNAAALVADYSKRVVGLPVAPRIDFDLEVI